MNRSIRIVLLLNYRFSLIWNHDRLTPLLKESFRIETYKHNQHHEYLRQLRKKEMHGIVQSRACMANPTLQRRAPMAGRGSDFCLYYLLNPQSRKTGSRKR